VVVGIAAQVEGHGLDSALEEQPVAVVGLEHGAAGILPVVEDQPLRRCCTARAHAQHVGLDLTGSSAPSFQDVDGLEEVPVETGADQHRVVHRLGRAAEGGADADRELLLQQLGVEVALRQAVVAEHHVPRLQSQGRGGASRGSARPDPRPRR
jgi:hypothetical protein